MSTPENTEQGTKPSIKASTIVMNSPELISHLLKMTKVHHLPKYLQLNQTWQDQVKMNRVTFDKLHLWRKSVYESRSDERVIHYLTNTVFRYPAYFNQPEHRKTAIEYIFRISDSFQAKESDRKVPSKDDYRTCFSSPNVFYPNFNPTVSTSKPTSNNVYTSPMTLVDLESVKKYDIDRLPLEYFGFEMDDAELSGMALDEETELELMNLAQNYTPNNRKRMHEDDLNDEDDPKYLTTSCQWAKKLRTYEYQQEAINVMYRETKNYLENNLTALILNRFDDYYRIWNPTTNEEHIWTIIRSSLNSHNPRDHIEEPFDEEKFREYLRQGEEQAQRQRLADDIVNNESVGNGDRMRASSSDSGSVSTGSSDGASMSESESVNGCE